MNSMAITIKPAPVRKTIRVSASQKRAFDVFTAGMGRWWRPDHHIAATPFADIVVEPRTGGRWFERDREGAECEWGTVRAWEPPGRLLLAWQLNADWKFDPDFVTELEVRFIAEGDKSTRVELEHRNLEKYGEMADAIRVSLDSPDGWNGALAAYATEAAKS
jgi:hypothetical protein